MPPLGAPHRLLSFPFRLAPNGAVATVVQDTEAADREAIAALCLTVYGERPLQPGFGITDPTLLGIDPAEVAAGVGRYGPPVRIEAVEVVAVDDVRQLVQVTFE